MADKKPDFNVIWLFAIIFVVLVLIKVFDSKPTYDFYKASQSGSKASSLAIENEELRRDFNNEKTLTEDEIEAISEPVFIEEFNKSRSSE